MSRQCFVGHVLTLHSRRVIALALVLAAILSLPSYTCADDEDDDLVRYKGDAAERVVRLFFRFVQQKRMDQIAKLLMDSPDRGTQLNRVNDILISTDDILVSDLEIETPVIKAHGAEADVSARVTLQADDAKTGKAYFPQTSVRATFKLQHQSGSFKIASFSLSVSKEDAVRERIEQYYQYHSHKNGQGVASILSKTLQPDDRAERLKSASETYAETGDITVSQLDIDNVKIDGDTATARVTVLLKAETLKGKRYYPGQPMVLDWELSREDQDWFLVRYSISNIKALKAEIRIRKLGGEIELDEKAKEHSIVEVNLRHAKLTEDDLSFLKDIPHLKMLVLSETSITDKGLAHVADAKNVTSLYLFGTNITDDGLLHLKHLTKLITLDLGDTNIGDKGLAHLEGLKDLGFLNLPQTRVTDAGFAKLKRSLPEVMRMNRE